MESLANIRVYVHVCANERVYAHMWMCNTHSLVCTCLQNCNTNHHDWSIRNDTGYHHETHDSYIHVYTYTHIKTEFMHLTPHNLRLVPAFPF